MPILAHDIVKAAQLARIQINENDVAELVEKLNPHIQLIDGLNAIATNDIQPMINPHDALQQLREDVANTDIQRERLLAGAPLTENGLFLVPKVIE